MNKDYLQKVLVEHKKWIISKHENGSCADLRGADLGGADLGGAYLGGADLSGANLSGAYLCGADLTSAYLSGANLSGANLSGAYLGGADLTSAYLSGAYLRGAYLRGADLGGADLRGAYLGCADLSGAKSILLIGPIGSRLDILYAIKHRSSIMVKTGCFWGTLKNFSVAVKKNHEKDIHGSNYRAAINMIKEWSKAK